MDWYDNLRAWFQGYMSPAASSATAATTNVVPGAPVSTGGASRMFGTKREKKGCTATGAKKCSTRRRR